MIKALEVLLAVLRVIPILKDWFDELVSLYIQSQLESMRQENRDAIKHAFEKQDQRPIEKVIGNPNAGEPSNLPGSERRDSLPNLRL